MKCSMELRFVISFADKTFPIDVIVSKQQISVIDCFSYKSMEKIKARKIESILLGVIRTFLYYDC